MKKVAILLALMVWTSSCKRDYSENNTPMERGTKLVRAVDLDMLTTTAKIKASGTIASDREVNLSFKIGGVVQYLRYDEGDDIPKGGVLARLDLSEIDAQVNSAQNAYDKSVRDLERATGLYRDTVGTLEQKQNAETAKEVAASNLKVANFNRRYAQVVSPVRGKVLKRYIEQGELVSPGQPIYRVAGIGKGQPQLLRFGLSDRSIVKVTLGIPASVHFDALPGTEFSGKITEVAQGANPKTGLFEVEVTLDSFDERIKNGFIGKVTLFPALGNDLYQIPMDALVEGSAMVASVFYTTNDQTVQRAEVAIRSIEDGYFTITSDQLPKGCKLITAGAPFLKHNDTINILQ
ncbi:MAG: efflux RND transporter periplasmic adaptor subunit [Bacteroidota bacterium]